MEPQKLSPAELAVLPPAHKDPNGLPPPTVLPVIPPTTHITPCQIEYIQPPVRYCVIVRDVALLLALLAVLVLIILTFAHVI